MRTPVIYASIAGFLIPVVCGLGQMLLFNAREGGWQTFVCYQSPNVLCPPWALGNGKIFWMIAIPVLNAILYGLIAFTVVIVRRLGRASV
jgi:hypothetical protein